MTSKTKKITRIGVVAALYATITLVLGSISYGLPLFGKEYILSLTIGCFLANVIGPYGVPDIILGTLATFISVYLVYLTGKHMKGKKGCLIIASLWPTIVNAIIVGGVMLHGLFKSTLILSILEVGFGQFVVITIIGVPLFRFLNNKYSKLLKDILN